MSAGKPCRILAEYSAADPLTLKATSTLEFYQQLLGPSGLVAGRVDGFTPRVQQIEMAAMIADAIGEKHNALIEAGTGTGKTFAYLLPVLHSRQRVMITTGSKTLQDQLFYEDIPLIVSLLDWPVKTALLKGRNNYLCPQRLEQHIASLSRYSDATVLPELVAVREWWQQTTSGDLTELADLESAAFVPMITSTVDNCLGAVCPHVAACPLYLARARAQDADLVVINHHLLFADLALKEQGFASLLPDVATIVVDEAHQIVDVARHFFGERVGSQQVVALCRDVRAELQVFAGDDALLANANGNLAASISLLVKQFERLPAGLPLGELLSLDAVAELIDQVDLAFGALSASLAQAAVRSTNFSHCYSRVNRLADHFALLTEAAPLDDNSIHWIERHVSGFTLHLSPVSIASAMQAHLDADKSWVLTSATLSVARQFSHFKRYLGIAEINECIFDSPFNFVEQAKAHIPEGLPLPGTDQHTRLLINYCLPLIRGHSGRTFFLFTSYRALHIARDIFEGYSDLPTLVQGSMAKPKLLARFREIPGCILLATNSFWEGVDVRGADLKCLIIDKLPFSSPDNPITAAQLQAITAGGGNAFLEHAVPEAAIALKQGFGRLIRQEADRGLFVLGDSRMRTRTYGKLFVESLPAMEWLERREQAIDYLEILES